MRVTIVTPSFPSEHCGISTYTGYLTYELGKLTNVEILGKSTNPTSLEFSKNVVKSIYDADIIHIQHAFGIYGYMGYNTIPMFSFLKNTRKPIVTTIHEIPENRVNGIKTFLLKPYFQMSINSILKGSEKVIAHSKTSLELIRKWRVSKNIVVIPHGIIQPGKKVDALKKRNETPIIGFFGFISKHKGIHYLLNAVVALPNIKLIIAGDPKTAIDRSYYRTLKNEVVRLGIKSRVMFISYIPDEDLAKFFGSVDVFIFPYKKCAASGALSLVLAHECVALTSDLPVFQELKTKFGCVETFDLSSTKDLTNKINQLLTGGKRRSELIQATREMFSYSSWEVVAMETFKLYKDIL